MMNVKAITIIIYSFLLGDSLVSECCMQTFRNKLFHLHRSCEHEEETEKCSETSAHKIQKPGNHLKEIIQHSEQDESLKSRIIYPIIKPREREKLCFTSDVQFTRPLQQFFVNVR